MYEKLTWEWIENELWKELLKNQFLKVGGINMRHKTIGVGFRWNILRKIYFRPFTPLIILKVHYYSAGLQEGPSKGHHPECFDRQSLIWFFHRGSSSIHNHRRASAKRVWMIFIGMWYWSNNGQWSLKFFPHVTTVVQHTTSQRRSTCVVFATASRLRTSIALVRDMNSMSDDEANVEDIAWASCIDFFAQIKGKIIE